MISPWKKIRYRLEWLAVLAIARLFPLLPRPLLLALAKILGFCAFHLDRGGRTTALQNLEAVYRNEKSPREIKAIALRSYQSFARTFCDQFWTTRLTKEKFFNICRFEHEDPETMEAAKKTGAIWVTPHYGNFEWISLTAGFLGYQFCVIAQEFKNPLLTRFFTESRQHTGHTVIPQRHSMLRLLRHLKKGGHAAFLTDLTIPPGKAATVIDCMGLKTCVTSLHAELMRRSQLPVIPGICIPQPDGTYLMRGFRSITFAPDASTRDIAQKCWNTFEPYIREHPEHWIWMYKHWRYHGADNSESYPPYSNYRRRFQYLINSDSPPDSSPAPSIQDG